MTASPLYKRKFDDAGIHPNDLRELSDLGNFPFTTKDDLREEYPFGMFAVPAGRSSPRARQLRHHRPAHPVLRYTKRTWPTGQSWWPVHCAPPASAPA